ncbi:hypothetical protein J0871_16795 [Salegentibacter sp. BDJ18]|uniref:hypothetical protein n=1 Tax=Salegentibacter sp. BDJ18 TaxID=2816376 RepID=UPI001AAF8CEE|nr:hypothetical protein [Salegentibacter sp. BDJ18]MBO2546077.1 hypothetical protein [Salegentibacter sp. BDJ18]
MKNYRINYITKKGLVKCNITIIARDEDQARDFFETDFPRLEFCNAVEESLIN